MSTASSHENFYVGRDGKEYPIRYKAESLVNKPAPLGYHWEQDLGDYYAGCAAIEEENARREERRKERGSIVPCSDPHKAALDDLYFSYGNRTLSPPRFPDSIYYIAVRDKE